MIIILTFRNACCTGIPDLLASLRGGQRERRGDTSSSSLLVPAVSLLSRGGAGVERVRQQCIMLTTPMMGELIYAQDNFPHVLIVTNQILIVTGGSSHRYLPTLHSFRFRLEKVIHS